MIFNGVLLNFDGQPDSVGEIFSKDTLITFNPQTPVTVGFDPKKRLGKSLISKGQACLNYELDISPAQAAYFGIPLESIGELIPAIGGVVLVKEGKKLLSVRIDQIALSFASNSDSRIKKLGNQS